MSSGATASIENVTIFFDKIGINCLQYLRLDGRAGGLTEMVELIRMNATVYKKLSYRREKRASNITSLHRMAQKTFRNAEPFRRAHQLSPIS